jgi:hypothetical protein
MNGWAAFTMTLIGLGFWGAIAFVLAILISVALQRFKQAYGD